MKIKINREHKVNDNFYLFSQLEGLRFLFSAFQTLPRPKKEVVVGGIDNGRKYLFERNKWKKWNKTKPKSNETESIQIQKKMRLSLNK